jgi:hypothetical protein
MQRQTGRQIVMQRLSEAIQRANTADLQRAAMFLEWAWDVRKGCAKQRGAARRSQAWAWKKNVDTDVRW